MDTARLCRTIRWLVSDIRRIKQGEKATARQRTNMRRQSQSTTLVVARNVLEMPKAHLRVRVTQLRRLRADARSKAINTAYRRQGKECLSSKSSWPEGVQPQSPKDIKSYCDWGGRSLWPFQSCNSAVVWNTQRRRLSFRGQYNARPPDLGSGDQKAGRHQVMMEFVDSG